MMPVALCIPFPLSTPCDDMLAMLVCATRWFSMHLYMLAYMFMHESCLLVCRPCFNTIKLWTFDPNLHFSLADTPFVCFLACCLLVCLLAFLFFTCHAYHAYPLCAFSYAFCIFSFHCLSIGFLSLPLHVHTWSNDAWSWARFARCKQKGRKCEQVNISQAVVSSRFRGSTLSHLVMYP